MATHNLLKTFSIGFTGDVMIGRLVNQALLENPHKAIWDTILPVMQKQDAIIINLETALTHSEDRVEKVFNFKSDPRHVSLLKNANIKAVNLANNHVLDYGKKGLLETLETLESACIGFVGAGRSEKEAKKIHVLEFDSVKVALFGCTDNEPTWKASGQRAGTFYVDVGDIEAVQKTIKEAKRVSDVVICSIHWGPNMVERPPSYFQAFAHQIIDFGVDIIHGHSAHIFQAVEIYKEKLILYDTGDFIDDYMVDPILRNDHSFLFCVEIDKNGPKKLTMVPVVIRDCAVHLAEDFEKEVLLDRMQKLCKEHNTVTKKNAGCLEVKCRILI